MTICCSTEEHRASKSAEIFVFWFSFFRYLYFCCIENGCMRSCL